MVINPNQNTPKEQVFLENKVFGETRSMISRMFSRNPSIKEIGRFLNSKTGKQYVKTKSCQEQGQIHKYLEGVSTKASQRNCLERIRDSFKVRIGKQTKIAHANEALISFNKTARESKVKKLNHLLNKVDDTFTAIIPLLLENEHHAILDGIFDAERKIQPDETKTIVTDTHVYYVMKPANENNGDKVKIVSRDVDSFAKGAFSAVFKVLNNDDLVVKISCIRSRGRGGAYRPTADSDPLPMNKKLNIAFS